MPVHLRARSRGAPHRQGHRVLGPRASRLRGAGLSLGEQGLRRADPRRRPVEADHGGPPRAAPGRQGARDGGRDHRPPQGRRGAPTRFGAPRTGSRAERRRSRGALSAGARGGALQAFERGALPAGGRQAHPAGVGRGSGRGGRAAGCRGPASPAARQAQHGERRRGRVEEDARPGRGMGPAAGRIEPVPVRAQIRRAQARAVPDGGGVPPSRAGGWTRSKPKVRHRRRRSRRSAC